MKKEFHYLYMKYPQVREVIIVFFKRSLAWVNPEWRVFQSDGSTYVAADNGLSLNGKGGEVVLHRSGVYMDEKLLLPNRL